MLQLFKNKKKCMVNIYGHPPIAWLLSDWWAQAGSDLTPSSLTDAGFKARAEEQEGLLVCVVCFTHLTYLLTYI